MANTELTKSLREYFEEYENVSIRKLAAATGINYGILLKLSKQPIPGEAYDPEAINWQALEKKLAAKSVDYTQLSWDELNAGPNRKGATLQKDMSAFTVGCEVYLRRDNEVPFVVLYKTATHIVIMQKGSTEPLAWAHNTFLLNGPSFERRVKQEQVEE